MTHTTIVIPTFRRPELLSHCLASCRGLAAPRDGGTWDVLVVDNSPDGEARRQVETTAANGNMALRYCHEPKPGISAARNRGISLCKGEYVAFLDDDETARKDWLFQLHEARERYLGVAVFGKVIAQVPGHAEWARAMLKTAFGRDLKHNEGEVPPNLVNKLGTGNSLFSLNILDDSETFEEALGLIGGEDTAVIQKVLHRGGRLVWAPQAQVYETVADDRATLRAVLERRFSSGQLRSYHEIQEGIPIVTAAQWMFLGTGQASIGAARGLLSLVTGQDPRGSLCEIAAGLGKILWFPNLRLPRYRRTAKSDSNE